MGLSSDPINPYNDHCTMNKVLEYMSFAKPQVLFDLKEGRASAGEAAVYVPENSPPKLGEAMLGVLDNPAEGARMGALGLQRISTILTWERSVQQLLAAYDLALAEQR